MKHISSICTQHLSDIMRSGGEPTKLALSDFTASFNLHSFMDYYAMNYGNDLGIEGDIIIDEEFKAKWTKHFDEHVNPVYKKGVELRMKLMGADKDKEDGTVADIYA